MKIKTIWTAKLTRFDDDVNNAMAEGYQLVRRDVLVDTNCLNDSVLYAELIQPDPEPEPEPVQIDWIKALHIVKAACLAHKGPCNDCPMTNWCDQLQSGGDPTDWKLPEG